MAELRELHINVPKFKISIIKKKLFINYVRREIRTLRSDNGDASENVNANNGFLSHLELGHGP